ncbi:DEAD/DEAH box helicase [Brenneria goodwinii]|uniref:DEAD/DEAH box helicase n=1 Tax=Brenneria goodwinii TaxID=1109412 RepID=UPI0036E1A886
MLKRDDPTDNDQFPPELKEAVCESLVRSLQWSVSGQGSTGQELVGLSPSYKYVSGFLEPIRIPRILGQVSDETTNPIHIISHGMDTEVADGKGVIAVKPYFSIYVRLLPTAEQIKKFRVKLTLKDEAKNMLDDLVYSAIKKYDSENSDLKKIDVERYFKEKKELSRTVTNDYLSKSLGISIDENDVNKDKLKKIPEEDMQAISITNEGEDNIISVENVIDDSEESLFNPIEFSVYPGMKSIIPGHIVKTVRPTPRWFRLDIDNIPEFNICTDCDDAELYEWVDKANRDIDKAISSKIEEWYRSPDSATCGKMWGYPSGKKFTSEQIQNWDKTLEEIRKTFPDSPKNNFFSIPVFNVKWNIGIRRNKNTNVNSIKICLENLTDVRRSRDAEVEYQDSIFLTSISAVLPTKLHRSIRLDRIKPSYRYNKYLTYPALGINCGIDYSENNGNTEIKTTWLPIYRQPRISPIHRNDIDVRFVSLTNSSGVKDLIKLPQYFRDWISSTTIEINPLEGVTSDVQKSAEQERFKQDQEAWGLEALKIEQGINLLLASCEVWKSNPNSPKAYAFLAWKFLNESMSHAAKGYDRWRLFQVCFILSQLSGITSRIKEFEEYYDENWDESVALLYFSTGGGKTESFFGLLIYNLFLDRLRGKFKGVTALIRYPLRLLTVQQAQRLAKTLASCEVIRRKYDLCGDPFAIGFWVGGGNTPNQRSRISDSQVPVIGKVHKTEAELQENSEYRCALEDWNKLPKCPFCASDTVLRKFPAKGGLIGHVCTNESGSCTWRKFYEGSTPEPLPFYIVDDDIYDKAPSVLLGTIDKLALLGHHPSTIRRFMGMLGCASLFNSNTDSFISRRLEENFDHDQYQKVYPFFENGERKFFDPFPSLIIQDEAHLLEESLGTFSGIFETAFESIITVLGKNKRFGNLIAKIPKTDRPRLPKIIAASATVSEPSRQIENLYQRRVTQFPMPGPTLYSSFYAQPKKSEDFLRNAHFPDNPEFGSCTARLYATMLTNGRPHTSAVVEVLGHFHLLISRWISGLTEDENSNTTIVKNEMLESLSESPLGHIYSPYIEKASFSQLATLIDLHRIALTYVTNKKGGDQIMAAENDTTGRIHEDANIAEFTGLSSRLISGALSAGEIEEVIQLAEKRPEPGEDIAPIFDEDLLRSVVATSAISHGVDVDEFNTMFFAGMPSDAAEYIQSSSRVGRTHVGCSILLPTPQRRRDRYIMETHDQYHRFLERMIRPAAINRWAESALIRTLPSLIQMYFIAVVELKELLNAADHAKTNVNNYERLHSILSLINRNGTIEAKKRLSEFVFDCVGLNHKTFAPPAVEEFKKIINNELYENFFDIINNKYEEGVEGLKEFFEELDARETKIKRLPMTSLRDVDPAGRISYEKRVIRKDPSSHEVYELIKRIQSGR